MTLARAGAEFRGLRHFFFSWSTRWPCQSPTSASLILCDGRWSTRVGSQTQCRAATSRLQVGCSSGARVRSPHPLGAGESRGASGRAPGNATPRRPNCPDLCTGSPKLFSWWGHSLVVAVLNLDCDSHRSTLLSEFVFLDTLHGLDRRQSQNYA